MAFNSRTDAATGDPEAEARSESNVANPESPVVSEANSGPARAVVAQEDDGDVFRVERSRRQVIDTSVLR